MKVAMRNNYLFSGHFETFQKSTRDGWKLVQNIFRSSMNTLEWMSYVGIVIGLAAAALVATIGLIQGVTPSLRLSVMAFCLTMPSYAIDRVVDQDKDGNAERGKKIAKMRTLPWVCGLIFIAGLLMALISARPLSSLVYLLFPGSVALYVVPWIPKHMVRAGYFRGQRIKDLPYAKSFYVPFCWSMLALLTAVFSGPIALGSLILSMIFVFLFLFINCISCDLRDVDSDIQCGVVTIAAKLGVTRTLKLLQLLNLHVAILIAVLVICGSMPTICLSMLVQCLVTSLYLHSMRYGVRAVKFCSDTISDAAFVATPIAALAVTLFGV